MKYILSLALAIFLFWLVYGDLNFKELFQRFREVNNLLLGLSIIFGLFSYYVRAYRWNILLEPLGYNLKSSRTFLAVMIGYFANLLVPRMGEFTRCASLKKTDNVEFASSLGSVVAERALDTLVLLFVTVIGLTIEFDKLVRVLRVPFDNAVRKFDYLFGILIAFVGFVILILIFLYFLYRKNKEQIRHNKLFIKIRSLMRDLLDGLLSIKKIKRPVGFWFSTIAIWILYFSMTYVVFLAFDPTMNLGIKAGILVLIMGGFGMATPVQGGVGSFHLFVSGILLLYGVHEKDGEFFAFVLHTSQFLSVLIIGGLSFVLSLFINKRNAKYANI